eukprot:9073995-Pyramimonas_sp.AAC.1
MMQLVTDELGAPNMRALITALLTPWRVGAVYNAKANQLDSRAASREPGRRTERIAFSTLRGLGIGGCAKPRIRIISCVEASSTRVAAHAALVSSGTLRRSDDQSTNIPPPKVPVQAK